MRPAPSPTLLNDNPVAPNGLASKGTRGGWLDYVSPLPQYPVFARCVGAGKIRFGSRSSTILGGTWTLLVPDAAVAVTNAAVRSAVWPAMPAGAAWGARLRQGRTGGGTARARPVARKSASLSPTPREFRGDGSQTP